MPSYNAIVSDLKLPSRTAVKPDCLVLFLGLWRILRIPAIRLLAGARLTRTISRGKEAHGRSLAIHHCEAA